MAHRIYTRTGDRGTTGIHGGARVPKDDPRIEAGGELDELNCQLGLIRAQLRGGWCSEPRAFLSERDEHQSREASRCPSEPGVLPSEQSGGWCPEPRAFFSERDEHQSREASIDYDIILHHVQKNLMTVMSLVSSPAAERHKNPNQLPPTLVTEVETTMDTLAETTGPALHFLLPGGTPLAAQLQLARAICRRAERRLWTLHRIDPLPEEILQYINRLSDLLFTMARHELARQDWPEERWQAFAYKNQK